MSVKRIGRSRKIVRRLTIGEILSEGRSPAERHTTITWAQYLTRVFSIDIEVCGLCGGSVRVIECIEDHGIINPALDHLRRKEQGTPARPLQVPESRTPSVVLQAITVISWYWQICSKYLDSPLMITNYQDSAHPVLLKICLVKYTDVLPAGHRRAKFVGGPAPAFFSVKSEGAFFS